MFGVKLVKFANEKMNNTLLKKMKGKIKERKKILIIKNKKFQNYHKNQQIAMN